MGTRKVLFPLIFKELPINKESVIYDLGSGLGTFLFEAEKCNPKKLIGIEYSPLHFYISQIRSYFRKSKIIFKRCDFSQTNISEATIIYLFLTPEIVKKLSPFILKNAKKGCVVISLGADMEGIEAYKVIPTDESREKCSKVSFYKISKL